MPDEITKNKRRARTLVLVTSLPVLVVAVVLGLLLPAVVAGVFAGILVAGWAAFASIGGPSRAHRALGGRPADPVTDARLVNLVDGLLGGAGVPTPTLLVLDDPAPNALSFGLDPRHATLAVTRGLLDTLDRIELEGVLARELARIKSHEIRPATVAVAVLTVVGSIGPVADRVRRAATASPSVAADASGVAITRYPPGLAAALDKLRGDVATGSPATAHLWVEPPASLLHPPHEERIEALREL
ncbi:MAG: htpX [Actinomycetia bacterium]|nr:htpX [Actinomycetes bacterium]